MEATPLATKGLTKLAILPIYRRLQMLCIALRPCQKLDMPLEFKLVQKFKLPNNNFNKQCVPKPIFLILKNQKDVDDF